MDLINVIVIFVVIGLILWLVETYIPLPAPIKVVLRVLVVLFLCIWLLQLFGIGTGIYIGRHH